MPFYFDYDLLLLSVGIVVYAADRQNEPAGESGESREDRWLLWSWTLVFLVQMLWKFAFNPVVPLLAAGAVLLIRRGLRSAAQPVAISTPNFPPAALAA
jgi:hypothetical protein